MHVGATDVHFLLSRIGRLSPSSCKHKVVKVVCSHTSVLDAVFQFSIVQVSNTTSI